MAITGIYFFKNNVCKFTKNLKKSKRGEFEITDLLKEYLKIGKLKYDVFENGFAWLDAGSHDSYLQASNFVETIEKRQGIKIACPEEIALRKKLIDKNQFLYLLKKYPNNEYKKYLKKFYMKKYKKIICLDLDGVICETKLNYYDKSKPKKDVIKYINSLYKKIFILKFLLLDI